MSQGKQNADGKEGLSDTLSLADLTKRLRSETMERVVESLGESRVAALRAGVLGLVVLWVLAWRFYGPQPVLVEDALRVYRWALGLFLISAIWWLAIRLGLVRMRGWMNVAGTIANYLVIAILTKHAFLLLITLEAVLPFLAIMIGAQYSQRWFKVGIAASLIVLLWSAPSGYWLSRPAYLVYAIVLTVGLPLLTGRIFSAVREISLQAIEAMDAQNRFVGAMSHELRTPLNVINNAIAMIDRNGMDHNQRTLIDLSETNAKVLSRRVNSVLDITKHNAGGIKLNLESIDTHVLMGTVRDVNAPDAVKRGITFQVNVADGVPRYIYGDQGRIEQVLSNLTANAIKYTPSDGQVIVDLFAETVADEKDVELVCTVTDTGIGIPDHEKRRIFDAFYQVSSGETRTHGGVGLGLFIVRNITERLGGSLDIRDNPGGGSIFTWRVKLPVAPDEPPADIRSIADLLVDHRSRVVSMSCLVIDDHIANVDIMRRLLAGAGHRVVAASDGPSGLAAMRERDFDMVFLDLHMPNMSGWDVLDELARHPMPRKAPIIVLSADADPDAASLVIAKGAEAFVSKPVSAKQLLDALMRVSGMSSGSRMVSAGLAPLDEIRQVSDRASVGVLLRHVREGLCEGLEGVKRALASGAGQQAAYHLHALRNEFGALGMREAAEWAAKVEIQTVAGQDFAVSMEQLDREINRALSWIEGQPEYDAAQQI
ncbi:ATP-binding protein [Luteimonas sp. TWI1416]|uniref:hybrid sensor histidine kinase/response regulator n=1 Tax=unclassified Luteimonas TaxID=2629088 RepID=UPI0032084EFC